MNSRLKIEMSYMSFERQKITDMLFVSKAWKKLIDLVVNSLGAGIK